MIIQRHHATISENELKTLLQSGQSERVAFVSAKASKRALSETLAALANTHGGYLLFGVTKNGTPQAEFDVQAMRDMIMDVSLLTDPPLILPSPQIINISTPENSISNPIDQQSNQPGTIVVVEVPSGLPHIYSLQGRYLTRADSQNRPLTTPELRNLILERGEASFESTPCENAVLDDLDPQRVERYLDRISAPPDEDALHVLLSRGCVSERTENEIPVPTIAGLLLFGRHPQRFMPSAEIICVRYAGPTMSDEFVRQDIIGTLPEQIRQAEAFVSSNMRRGMKITAMTREESTEYPIAVVREAIVNAIAHRNYSIRGEGIRLLMFSDRMEVYSPGRLPGHVTLDNLVDERFSRNEAIVAILTDLGYIERLGYGIDRMIATMSDAGLPAPLFEETAAGFRVTLQSASDDLVSEEPRQQLWQHLFLNERQEQAMAHVHEHGRITNSEFQALVPDVSAETIRRELADLVNKNLLLRIGEKRATYYILK
ncbi:putative DNA binding domain-containing protein [Chloroflexi bacterium TSY]|nr:putative DNA binding domain-containing protein [Chloroflexi bacterium TSY]